MSPLTDKEIDDLLFNALSQKPDASLPADFAAKVLLRLRLQQERKVSFWVYVLYSMLFFMVVVCAWWGLSYVDTGFMVLVATVLKYKWIGIFLGLMFGLMQFIDAIVIERTISSKKKSVASNT